MRIFFLIIIFIIPLLIYGQQIQPKFENGKIFVKIKDSSQTSLIENAKINIEDPDFNKLIKLGVITEIECPFSKLSIGEKLKKVYVISFKDTVKTDELIKRISRLPYVEYVERIPLYETYYTPNDFDPKQYNLTLIDAQRAWGISKGSAQVVIAVVDNAVMLNHKDLQSNIWVNPMEKLNGIDDDGNGYIDDINGFDVANNDNDPSPPPFNMYGHGTHCAGIVSATTDNSIGISSIGFTTKIMAVKASDDLGDGKMLSNPYEGVAYAIATGADIISMSWGGDIYSNTYQLLMDAAYNKNIVCIAAAGNSNNDVPHYPASYNHVISVAATDKDDKKASFSSYGSSVDVSAPGVNIYSTYTSSSDSYTNLSGTSMSCPLVAGLCGLMLSLDTTLTPDEIESCLKSSSDNIDALNSGFTGKLGKGRINAYKALMCIQKNPIASFEAIKNICTGSSIDFANNSYGNITSWQWTFPGGNPSSSNLKNPVVTYSIPGNYDVTLTAQGPFGTNTLNQVNYVHVQDLTATMSGSGIIPPGGPSFIKINFSGQGPWNITYSNGSVISNLNNITSNPYFLKVSATNNTTYSLQSVSSPGCAGTASGTFPIVIDTLTSCIPGFIKIFEIHDAPSIPTIHNIEPLNIYSSTGGNFYLGGSAAGTEIENNTWFLSKLDKNTNPLWAKTYKVLAYIATYPSIITTTDGGFLATGNFNLSSSVEDNLWDIYVTKMDSLGNIQWTNTYGGNDEDMSNSVAQASDGGFIICGWTRTSLVNSYIIKIDSNGNLQWTKTIDCGTTNNMKTIKATTDRGFVMLGTHDPFISKAWVIKSDSLGNVQWNTSLNIHLYGVSADIIQTLDGGYLLSGTTPLSDRSNPDAFLARLDADGVLQWSKVFSKSNSYDMAWSIIPTQDGQYMVTGSSLGGEYLTKFDINGNFIFTTLVGSLPDYSIPLGITSFHSLLQTSDGSYYGATGFLFKANCLGNTGCGDTIVFNIIPYTFTPSSKTITTYSHGGFIADKIVKSDTLKMDIAYQCSYRVVADFFASDTTVCVNDSVLFTNTSTGAGFYKWIMNGKEISSKKNLRYVFKFPGRYKIFLYAFNSNGAGSNGAMGVDSIEITANPLPVVTAFKDTILCKNSSVQLSASGANNYLWSPATTLSCANCSNPLATPLVSTKYIITGIDSNRCKSRDTIFIDIKCCLSGIPIRADFTFDQPVLCIYDSLEITNTSYASSLATYQWSFGTSATPSTSSSKDPGKIKYNSSGWYPVILIVNDSCGKDTIIKNIAVTPPPIVNYQDTILCASNVLQVDQTPVDDYDYKWSPIYGVSNPLIANPSIYITDTIIYYKIEVTNFNTGCKFESSMKVQVLPLSKAFAGMDTTVEYNYPFQLNGCCGFFYKWSPADYLGNAHIKNPTAILKQSMTYCLQVSDSFNCVASDTIHILVKRELVIPNLITVNQDGYNDYFIIKDLCPDSNLEIYNRWGSLIYRNDNYHNKWSSNSEGVFYYYFTDSCTGRIYEGWVHVMY